ncbi:MAG: hypothetical protein M3457_09655 [Chloroflexota bacterium]|nr:hypothetical protein [Chloroflexota bacterium]
MSSRDRLWATLAIWIAVTIVLTSFLVNANVWLFRGDVTLIVPGFLVPTREIPVYETNGPTDGRMVLGLVTIVVTVVVGATIATLGVWGQLRKPDKPNGPAR